MGDILYNAKLGKPGDNVGYVRYTITDIDDTWLTIQITYLNPARMELQTQTTHVLKNATGFGYPASSVDSIYYPVTDMGTDTVETEWGQLSAQHYQYSYDSLDQTYTIDI
jgi:hypothetical protein